MGSYLALLESFEETVEQRQGVKVIVTICRSHHEMMPNRTQSMNMIQRSTGMSQLLSPSEKKITSTMGTVCQ